MQACICSLHKSLFILKKNVSVCVYLLVKEQNDSTANNRVFSRSFKSLIAMINKVTKKIVCVCVCVCMSYA